MGKWYQVFILHSTMPFQSYWGHHMSPWGMMTYPLLELQTGSLLCFWLLPQPVWGLFLAPLSQSPWNGETGFLVGQSPHLGLISWTISSHCLRLPCPLLARWYLPYVHSLNLLYTSVWNNFLWSEPDRLESWYIKGRFYNLRNAFSFQDNKKLHTDSLCFNNPSTPWDKGFL